MQKTSFPYRLLFLLFVSVLLFSAKEIPATKEELIQFTVAEKLAAFQKKEKEKCRQKILEKAGILADSMLITRVRMQEDDKPEIPFRPDRPEVKLPKDSTPVAPIFPEGKIINTPKENNKGTTVVPGTPSPATDSTLIKKKKKRWDQ